MSALPSVSRSSSQGRPPEWRLHPVWERALLALFALVLALPAIGALGGFDTEKPRDQGRDRAPFPDLRATWTSVSAWPANVSRYFEDHFAFRARLVRWQAACRFVVLRVSPLPTVIRGGHGWLFYADDGALEDYTNATPFGPEDLDRWATTLQHTQDWLEAHGTAYLFVIAPDKHLIYPEFMPASIHRGPGPSRIDQLVTHLREHSTVHVLDLRPAMQAAKRRERIYHRTDTHWNDRGAVVAYRQIMDRLTAPSHAPPLRLTPWPEAAFEASERLEPGWDLAEMMGLSGLLTEQDLVLVPRNPRAAAIVEPLNPDPKYIEGRLVTEISDSTRPRAVVFRDSFGSALVPFLAEHFSRAVFLWEYDVDPDVVTKEHPQVVIQEWAGRRLGTQLPYDGMSPAVPPPASDGAAVSSTEGVRR